MFNIASLCEKMHVLRRNSKDL